MNDSSKPTKKNITPEQKAKAQGNALKWGVLVYDATTHLAVAFGMTLVAWVTAIGLGHYHIPFLPVWLASFGALMALRHVGSTWGKAKSAGQLQAQLEAYKAAMLAQATMWPKGGGASLDQLLDTLKKGAGSDKGSGGSGLYM